MPSQPRSAAIRYGAAILAIMVAAVIRIMLEPLLDGSGWTLFFVASVIAAWYGGLGPSLLAVTMSIAVSVLFFSRPPGSEPVTLIRVVLGLATFFFVGVVTALLSESMRAAQRRAEAQAEEAVRQREQLRTTLACIGEGVIVTDKQGRLTMMNAVAEFLTGWKTEEARGQPLETIFQIRDEQTRLTVENPIARVLNEGIIVGLTSHTVLTAKDGTERPIHESAAPIQDSEGNVTGVVLIFRDVTESRRSELALRDADRRKDEFLAMLAHELRNPLAPICSSLDILRNNAATDDTQQRAKEVMDRQVQLLVRLVDDLLDVSRIMRGKIELRPEIVDLKNIVGRAIEIAEPVILAQNHHLTVSLPDEPVKFNADPVRLAQVINNLLTNAAKYTEPGGQIWLTGERLGDQVSIHVRDTGIGIPQQMLPQVFLLFTQVDSSVNRSQGGLGIGLTLVKSLVELNGGVVEAHSDGLGKGSEFVIRLPIGNVQAQQAPETAVTSPTPDSAAKYRILVADDNTDAAETLTMLLRFSGHTVHVAHDGPTALEKAKLQTPDVVFLDVGMPRMDGLEVARRMRQMTETKDAVLVAVTGWGSDEDRRRTHEAGFNCHMVKPVTYEAINQVLEEIQTS